MIPTDDEDAYLLAMGFDKMLDVGYDSGVPFFMSTLVKFISLNPKNGVSLKSVFECKHIYSWYYGSTLNKIVLMVFQLDIYNYFNSPLTRPQIQDALHTCYILIINDYCSSNLPDYYGETLYQYLCQIDPRTLSPLSQEYLPSFKYLFKHGPKIILIQQKLISRCVSRILTRKKKAVMVIERQWQEVICNPYTSIGKGTLRRNAERFYALAQS